jgi:hypothetical protein
MSRLSYEAERILNEAWCSCWESDGINLADVEVIVASTLRAAALMSEINHLTLLALADELDGFS